jgi:hypothetical protein
MIFALFSILTAFVIGFGRQSAVFLKLKLSLWFFSNFEKKRIIFTFISVFFGITAILLNQSSNVVYWLLGLSSFILLTAFLFDFKYIFPEIIQVEKKQGLDIEIFDNKEIIGVDLGSQAIAYPLDVVMTRHIVNDKIGEQKIVICYCALCRSGLAFSSQVDNYLLYFRVSGVWRRNMIMEDMQTRSIWQQATGECIYGTLKGHKLVLLSGEKSIWSSWLKKHPQTTYAYRCVEARKGYLSISSMMKGLEKTTTRIIPPGFSDISELPSRETVFGINYNGLSKAYPRTELKGKTVILDSFGDKNVELHYDENADCLSAKDRNTNKKIIVEKHWWLGWKEFHPETMIWNIKA